MKINWLEIVILAGTVLLAFAGYRRGFVKKLAAMLSLVLSIAMVSAILPYMTDFLQNHTPLYSYIVNQCDEVLTRQTEGVLSPGISLSRIQENEFIENLPVPVRLKEMMLDYNNDEGYKRFDVTNFRDYITHYIAKTILDLISFIAATILVQLILRIALAAMDIISHIPVIGGLNRLFGLALGLVEALFLIWIFFLVLTAAMTTEWGLQLMTMVQQSKLLSYLYNENLFMKIILQAAVLF